MQTISEMAGRYCVWLRERNYSVHTVVLMKRHLRTFSNWCEERDIKTITSVTKDSIRRYEAFTHNLRKESGEAYSVYAKSQRLSAVKTFFTWLTKQGVLVYNAASDVVLPKIPKRLPRNFFSIEEAEVVLNAPDITTPLGQRDRAIMEVFYSTGMRKMELTNLALPDIDFAGGLIMIRSGKGNKDRVVPVGQRALGWVTKYLIDVRPKLVRDQDDGTVFLSNRGCNMYDGGLSVLVRKYIVKAGIEKKGACHLFRHSCATLMLEGGADIRYIQELLGHEHLSTTQIYASVTLTKLKEVHEKCHPG